MQSRGTVLVPAAVRGLRRAGRLLVFGGALHACQPPSGPASQGGFRGGERQLPGIDTSDLTNREREDWWSHVSALPAPCPNQRVSVAECVTAARPCASCQPAAKLLLRQVRLGKTRQQVEGAFRVRFSPDAIKSVDLAGSPSKGPKDAAVVIVEWADFECPFCMAAAPLFDFLRLAYPGHVRVVFKHFPISHHANAELAARAAVAAQHQGRFWRMHDLMITNGTSLNEPGLQSLAEKAGLDLAAFKADLSSELTRQTILRDKRQADELGLTGTPMVYINGRYFDFAYFDLLEDLDDWIHLEIELRTGQLVAPLPVDESKWPLDEKGDAEK